MTWIIITVIGAWMALSAFVLLLLCMNSSRLSQKEAPVKRRFSSSARRKHVPSQVQPSTASLTGD